MHLPTSPFTRIIQIQTFLLLLLRPNNLDAAPLILTINPQSNNTNGIPRVILELGVRVITFCRRQIIFYSSIVFGKGSSSVGFFVRMKVQNAVDGARVGYIAVVLVVVIGSDGGRRGDGSGWCSADWDWISI